MCSLDPGVGRTTVAVLLAGQFGRARSEPVLLVGADSGVIARCGVVPAATVADVAALGDPGRPEVLAGAVRRSRDGVWVLPGDEPDEHSYAAAVRALHRHFPLSVVDCPAGLDHPLTVEVLRGADTVILLTEPDAGGVDGVRTALAGADLHGRAAGTLVVVNRTPRRGMKAVLTPWRELQPLCQQVLPLPADAALARDGELVADRLARRTRRAAATLAAATFGAAAEAGPDR